jgi:ABC-2 type transport system ATP-binding protein
MDEGGGAAVNGRPAATHVVGSKPAIELHDVALAYRLARNRSRSLQEHMFSVMRRQVTYSQHWALKGVSLTVNRGELLAVIGPNGAGKSTTLKLIARILPPARGRVIVRGQVAPMIALGTGFNPDLTGRENVVMYGALLGHDVAYMRRRAPDIAEWAGLEDYLDVPIRSYSSGMVARLAFSVATDGQPDVLLVDEILAVGDEAFLVRSRERIRDIIDRGTAVIVVTHSLELVSSLADRALWLEGGQVVTEGSPQAVASQYQSAALLRAGEGVRPPMLQEAS